MRWTWDEFQALPHETSTVDIHCVTKWSKFDTRWEGVSVDTLLDAARAAAGDGAFVVAYCDGGYTTNLPLADVTGGKAWIAFGSTARRSRPSTGAGAIARAAPLLLEEREVGARAALPRAGRAGILGIARLPQSRRSVARAALPGRSVSRRDSTWQVVDSRRVRDETPRARTLVLDVPDVARASRRAARGRPARRAEDGYRAERSIRSRRRPRSATSSSRSNGSMRARCRHTCATCCAPVTDSRCAVRSAATSCGARSRPARCCSSPAAPASCR